MGPTYNAAMAERLENSHAAKTGFLRDLCDCELLIPQISSDRISDITVNVIRHKLTEFTAEQCRRLHVPMRTVPGNPGWSQEHQFWVNKYAELPVYGGHPIILVPKWAVRRKMTYDHQEYWRHWCLDFLQQEHLNANTALVRTLKNGRRKVAKKDIERELPCDKEAIARFTEAHPKVFEKYKRAAPLQREPLNDRDLCNIIYNDGRMNITIVQDGGTAVKSQNVVNGNVVGGVVGSGTVNARDITTYRDRISKTIKNSNWRQALLSAREQVETFSDLSPADRANAADSIGQITQELEKANPSASVFKRCLRTLKDYAQPAYQTLMAVKTIAELANLKS